MKDRFKSGFTLAELMIVVVIVGILVAVSIPIFTMQLEKSRQATDLANMRSASAAAIADWYMVGNGGDYSKKYDAAKGVMTDTVPEGYGKSSEDSSVFASNLHASGVPNPGTPRYITVSIDSLGAVTITWGGNSSYLRAVSPYKNQTLVDLKNMPNSERIKADQETLKAIADEILKQGWKINDLKSNVATVIGGAYRIADYYQDKTGLFSDDSYQSDGITITCKPFFQEILSTIGYDGNVLGEPSDPNRYVENLGSGFKDIKYDSSLFYSDALATNKYKNYSEDQTRRIIFLKDVKTDSSGVITGFTIIAKAHKQADMDSNDKKPFEIKISKDSNG